MRLSKHALKPRTFLVSPGKLRKLGLDGTRLDIAKRQWLRTGLQKAHVVMLGELDNQPECVLVVKRVGNTAILARKFGMHHTNFAGFRKGPLRATILGWALVEKS